jgi:hypothetical protein
MLRAFEKQHENPRAWLKVRIEVARAIRDATIERNNTLDQQVDTELRKFQNAVDALDSTMAVTQRQWLELQAHKTTLSRLLQAQDEARELLQTA